MIRSLIEARRVHARNSPSAVERRSRAFSFALLPQRTGPGARIQSNNGNRRPSPPSDPHGRRSVSSPDRRPHNGNPGHRQKKLPPRWGRLFCSKIGRADGGCSIRAICYRACVTEIRGCATVFVLPKSGANRPGETGLKKRNIITLMTLFWALPNGQPPPPRRTCTVASRSCSTTSTA